MRLSSPSLFPYLIGIVLFSWLSASALPDSQFISLASLFPRAICGTNSGNYTTSSKFATNLYTLLNSITPKKSVSQGFYNITAGANSHVDLVNVIALCRGDLPSSDCATCLSNAVSNITVACPNQKEGVIWDEKCMVRYSNRSIFNTLETSPGTDTYNWRNVSDPNRFDQLLGKLLKNLQTKAASGDSRTKFADGSVPLNDFDDLNALVQCTPDLSFIDCSNCIGDQINYIPKCCGGKQGAFILNPSCTLRFEIYPFFSGESSNFPPQPQPQPQPQPPPPDGRNNSSSKGKGFRVSMLVVAIVVPVCLIIGCCVRRRKRRRKRRENVETSSSVREAEHEIDNIDSFQYDLDTLKSVTNNFSDDNKLGRGGFGPVYKGLFSNGQQIAVKRLAKNSAQGEIEFKNEVLLLAKLQHRNLVRLQGFCFDREEKLLIYEFVPNRSLDHFIFALDLEKRAMLDWRTRYNIITGIARGLLYLHEDSRLRIIHRDLKASNILLDAEMIPKIADFGLARLFEVDQTQGDTKRVAGTYGYMAPEYALHGLFSARSDVYSFGIVLLEMITGIRNTGMYQEESPEDLVSWVWRNWKEGTAVNVIDETIRTGNMSDIMKCINIGLLCVQEEASERPTMSTVVIMLSSDSVTLPEMKHPAYVRHGLNPLNTPPDEHSSEVTNSQYSGSTLVPR